MDDYFPILQRPILIKSNSNLITHVMAVYHDNPRQKPQIADHGQGIYASLTLIAASNPHAYRKPACDTASIEN